MNDKSIPELKQTAQKWFNKYIRLRDCDEYGNARCISSGQPLKYGTHNYQAGHFYAATVENLRFNEDNVHVQGKSDNYFKSGNQLHYRENLLKKIGKERVEKLEMLAAYHKRHGHRWDRFSLQVIIDTYKEKCKELAKTKMFEVK